MGRRTVARARRNATAKRRDGVSVYYPFALVELIDYLEADGYEATGDVLLSLRDEDGVMVTVRLSAALARALHDRLGQPPERSA